MHLPVYTTSVASEHTPAFTQLDTLIHCSMIACCLFVLLNILVYIATSVCAFCPAVQIFLPGGGLGAWCLDIDAKAH